MELTSVRCNHCGAPLEISETTRFLTCQFCHSQLEVKRNGTAIFTEELERIAQNTDRMAGSLEVIELQNEIERLDREWAAEHPVTYNREGQPTSPPTQNNAIFQLGFSIFFAIVCFGMASFASPFAPRPFSFVPVAMGVFVLIRGIMGLGKADHYQKRKAAYELKRASLLTQLNARREKR